VKSNIKGRRQDDVRSYLNACYCTNVRKASRVVTRLYDEVLNKTGIRSTQLIILMELYCLEETTISGLADKLVMDASTVVRNLRPLVKMDFIEMKSGRDRRVKMVFLTQKGYDMVHEGLHHWQVAQQKVSDALQSSESSDHVSHIDQVATAVLALNGHSSAQ